MLKKQKANMVHVRSSETINGDDEKCWKKCGK